MSITALAQYIANGAFKQVLFVCRNATHLAAAHGDQIVTVWGECNRPWKLNPLRFPVWLGNRLAFDNAKASKERETHERNLIRVVEVEYPTLEPNR